jgi:hypothetical protein
MGADEVERGDERRRADLRGYLRRGGEPVEPVEFEDISDSGCCIRRDLPIGEIVVATVPTLGTIEAQVRWSIGGRSGLRILSRRTEDVRPGE